MLTPCERSNSSTSTPRQETQASFLRTLRQERQVAEDLTSNMPIITLLTEIKTFMKDLQCQAEINTQLLQSLLDLKNNTDDSILESYELPADDMNNLCVLEDDLKRDKSIFHKLVSNQHYVHK